MRTGSVSQLAPVLLRHLGTYAELAAGDLARSRSDFGLAAVGLLMFLASVLFALQLLCLAAVAAAWDTAYRMPVIYGLLGVFTLLAVGAAIHLRRVQRTRMPHFSALRREWELDRHVLSSLLAPGGNTSIAPAPGSGA
jgi:uncharacterized membrane protein YqjE